MCVLGAHKRNMSNSIRKKYFKIYLNWQRVINPIKYSKKEVKNKNAMQEWRALGVRR